MWVNIYITLTLCQAYFWVLSLIHLIFYHHYYYTDLEMRKLRPKESSLLVIYLHLKPKYFLFDSVYCLTMYFSEFMPFLPNMLFLGGTEVLSWFLPFQYSLPTAIISHCFLSNAWCPIWEVILLSYKTF